MSSTSSGNSRFVSRNNSSIRVRNKCPRSSFSFFIQMISTSSSNSGFISRNLCPIGIIDKVIVKVERARILCSPSSSNIRFIVANSSKSLEFTSYNLGSNFISDPLGIFRNDCGGNSVSNFLGIFINK